MVDTLYPAYVLALLLLPLLVRWRWGLKAALLVGVIELALVALAFHLMSVYRLFPDLYAGEATPEHPFARMRRGQVAGFVLLLIYGAVPAAAALAGSALATAWSLATLLWRTAASRGA